MIRRIVAMAWIGLIVGTAHGQSSAPPTTLPAFLPNGEIRQEFIRMRGDIEQLQARLPEPAATKGAAAIDADELRKEIAQLRSEVEELKRMVAALKGNRPLVEPAQAAEVPDAEAKPPQSPSGATPAPSGGTVQVRGYYRKDGTYVRPYTRRK